MNEEKERECSRCGVSKPHNDFYKGRGECKSCTREKNSINRMLKYQERYDMGLCTKCGGEKTTDTVWCESCAKKRRERDKNRRARARQKVLDYYGRICACCGEDEELFLTIDHVNNDGSEHRDEVDRVAEWIVKEGFPTGFQILCFNCNTGKHLNDGTCPHE